MDKKKLPERGHIKSLIIRVVSAWIFLAGNLLFLNYTEFAVVTHFEIFD